MKRIKNIYHYVYDLGNLKSAILNAAKYKKQRPDVQRVLKDVDGCALILQNLLINKSYVPSPCKMKTVTGGTNNKKREVCCPEFFPDLCIQWALIQILSPVIMKSMYIYNCGCIPGRGNLYVKKTVEKWVRKDYQNTKYCLTMDVDRFYPSINTGFLKNAFRRRIKDGNMLWLIDTIIDVQDKGLPMGFYTSTWFANFMLTELDHKIKEQFGAVYYIRNIDDLEIFGPNKKKLHKIRIAISEYLATIGLKLNDNWQVFKYAVKHTSKKGVERVGRVLDFVGYRFYRTHTLVRKKITKRFRRRISKAKKRMIKGRKPTYNQAAGIFSYLGWTKHADCYNFYQVNIKSYFKDLNILKGVIRYESAKRKIAGKGRYNTKRKRSGYITS
ncbi:MAG: RNA-directed DNA polymerase [Eubacterium sp.]